MKAYNKQIRLRTHITLVMIRFATLIAFTLAFSSAKSQNLEVAFTGQETIMGLQTGTEVGWHTRKGLVFGGFYQASNLFKGEDYTSSYPFAGGFLQFPIRRCGGVEFSGRIKAGLVNNQFAIVTPELDTRVHWNSFLSTSVNLGYRAGYASIGARFILRLNP